MVEAFSKNSPFDILAQLRDEESEMDSGKVKQKFLDIRSVYHQDGVIFANISHWNGEELPWRMKGSIDSQGLLHGPCSFALEVQHYNSTGTHDFLNWSLKLFTGSFHHGKLNGLGIFVTWDGANVFAKFKNGELHGPAFGFGRIPVFDIQVSYLLMIFA